MPSTWRLAALLAYSYGQRMNRSPGLLGKWERRDLNPHHKQVTNLLLFTVKALPLSYVPFVSVTV